MRVAIEPFEGYLGLEDDLVSALEEDAAGMTEMPDDLTVNEIVYQNMLEILQQKIDKPVYGDPEEYTIHVTEGDDRVYEIPKEELIELDYACFLLDEADSSAAPFGNRTDMLIAGCAAVSPVFL